MNAIIGRLIPAVFGAIGLVIIVSLWTADGFGEPPLFFKLVGTLMASIFVLVGVAGALGLQPKASPIGPTRGASRADPQAGRQGGRQGATQLACTYCQRWFNVHAQA